MPAQSAKEFSEVYAAYAAGCLDPAFAMMVETQGMLRPEIRESVAASEVIAGAMLEAASESPMQPDALDRALAAIDAFEATDDVSRRASLAASAAIEELLALPEPLRSAAMDAAGRTGWQSMGRGLKRLPLDVDSALDIELYRIAPGARIPRHSHAGAEYTLVVAGGFSDERGSYGPGDVLINGPDDCHQPVGDDGEVCFALAVRDGGLHFTGMMGVIQRILGAR